MSWLKDINNCFESNDYTVVEVQATDHRIGVWDGWVIVTNNTNQQDYQIGYERCCELLSMEAKFSEIVNELELTIIEE